MSWRTAATHRETGPQEPFADCAPMNAHFGTDLTESPALGIQVAARLTSTELR
jgi:hypothetical protein